MATSKSTLPWTDEMARTLAVAELLLGVKTTLNREAVKPELSWHVFNDVDLSIWMSSAATGEKQGRAERTKRSGLANENLMIASCARGADLISLERMSGRRRGPGESVFRVGRASVSLLTSGSLFSSSYVETTMGKERGNKKSTSVVG